MGLHHSVSRWFDYLKRVKPLIKKELSSKVDVPWNIRLKMWRMGFLGESYVLYGLDKNDPREFLSDAGRFIRTPLIDREYGFCLDNKIVFPRIFLQGRRHTVENFFMVKRNTLLALSENTPSEEDGGIRELIERKRRLILKPYGGGGGRYIFLLEKGDDRDQYLVNGKIHDGEAFGNFVERANGCLVCEYVDQANYSKEVFPGSVNTLRILTMWDDRANEPFIAVGVHRFGSKETAPVDNWTQGGISARIDLESGRLGKGATYPKPKNNRLEWLTRHPDTDTPIEGLEIPGWKGIRQGILEIAGEIPFLPYVGWDVIVTESGFKVLEGNCYSDVNLLQIHGPLLRDDRVRRFYERQGILG